MGWRSAYRAGSQFAGWLDKPTDGRRTPGPILPLLLILGFFGWVGEQACNAFEGLTDGGDVHSSASAQPESAPTAAVPASVDKRSLCGDPDARPSLAPAHTWPSFQCRNPSVRNNELCFARAEYSDVPGTGCPGRQLCCSP